MGDLGPWAKRIYLAGGLAPRYLVGSLPEGAAAHVGTTDVDFVIGLVLGDEDPETYRTLLNGLEKAELKQTGTSFRWTRDVDGVNILVEFLGESEDVEPGQSFRLKGQSTGSGFQALNARGANLAREDFVERDVEGERLDEGGRSRVPIRVVGTLTYVVLKVLAFQSRHENKDSYDLIFVLLNHSGGPEAAGRAASQSPVADHEQVKEALTLLEERFADGRQDGPAAYATFLATPDDQVEAARLRQEAVGTVGQFLRGFHDKES